MNKLRLVTLWALPWLLIGIFTVYSPFTRELGEWTVNFLLPAQAVRAAEGAPADFPVYVPLMMGTRQPQIVFVSDRPGFDTIHRMNEDGSGITPLSEDYGYAPDFSPDGTQFVYVRQGCIHGCTFSHDIVIMNLDGKDILPLTNTSSIEEDSPEWSPDGSKILFVAAEFDDVNTDIYVMDRDGTNVQQVTNTPYQELDPQWLPNGTQIGFWRGTTNSFDIFIINADGTGEFDLTNSELFEQYPVWSPDGTQIAFTGGSFTCTSCGGIYVMNADGSNVRQLPNLPGDEQQRPAWSPDGTQLLFDANHYEPIYHNEIYVINADGSNIRQLTHGDTVNDWAAAWQP